VPAGSTKKLYLHGLSASLVNLVVVSIYSLVVIRLSLDYLGKDEFGLLSLITQVSTYIAVIDLGLFTAFSRILIDYTTGNKEHYANALRTATRVFHILGFIGILTAAAVALGGSVFLSIPQHLHREFTYLMLAQGISIFCAFSLKPITTPLVANGKHYYIYWLNSALTLVNVLLFWLGLKAGVGIYSSLLASFVVLILSAFFLIRLARPYLERGEFKGRFDRSIFKEVVSFARDSMLWQIGGQTLASLPIILASAWFTLGTTADLSAGMKLILLLVSICTRFGDMSVTPLSIQFANGNESKAAAQMTSIAGISGGIGASAALVIVCANPAFISWWMFEKVSWNWQSNIAGALWVAIVSVNQCMYGFAVISRQMQLLRWALISECLFYIAIALLLKSSTGPAALLWAKPAATLIIGLFLLIRMGRHTRIRIRSLVPGLLRQAIGLAIMVPPCLFATEWVCTRIHHQFVAFLTALGLAFLAVLVAFPILFTREMRFQIFRMSAEIWSKIKSKLLPVRSSAN
jgi:O-antigen/teichoic acid export membrane protein